MKIETICLTSLLTLTAGIISAAEHDHAGHDHAAHSIAESHTEHKHGDSDEHDEHGDHDEHGEHSEAIKMTPAVMQEFGIELAAAGPGTIDRTTKLPGEIAINQDRLAHIVPRYPGMVLEVHKNIGDQVRNGEAVAVLESNDSLTPYTLKSRIDGTVIAKHITLGESLNDSHSCYTIADLSNVWINITLYQKDLNLVKKGQSVTVYGGEHMQPARGSIAYVSPILDEHTRTGCARVVLPNPDGRWKPGMFITAEISIGSTKAAVAIPPTAIHTINGSPAVFVLNEDGFEPRPVKTGHANRNLIEISDGLKTGEQYAAKGGFTLKAELGRGNLHSGHNH